jgi:hypothetical protein
MIIFEQVTKGKISFSFNDKSTTGSQYIVLKQLKNSEYVGVDFVRQVNKKKNHLYQTLFNNF